MRKIYNLEPLRTKSSCGLCGSWLILFLLFLGLTPLLYAEEDPEQRFTRRIAWRGSEHAWRYAVEIEILQNESYRSFSREYTTEQYMDISLPPGEFRFRVISYDILGRHSEGSQWVAFDVRPRPAPEQLPEIEAELAARSNPPGFNTLGFSVGTSFIDPLVIVTAHGTFSVIRNFYIELGCDFGFISRHDYVENFYNIYPFLKFGIFLPFREKGGFFASAGCGYMFGNYTLDLVDSLGDYEIGIWGINFTAGVNLFDFLNISHTLKTTFNDVSHKLSVGYVYRFRERGNE